MVKKFKAINLIILSMIFIFSSIVVSYGETHKIYLTGDLMCQYNQQDEAKIFENYYNFDDTFSLVKEIFKDGELVVGNLETMVSKSNVLGLDLKNDMGKPYLNAPSDFLKSLKKAGYKMVVTANNHNCDTGKAGLLETMDALEDEGIKYTGYFRNNNDKRYQVFTLGNIKLGLLSYATYFNTKENKLSFFDRMYMLNRYSDKKIITDIKQLRSEGVDFIIAYNHWGSEYVNVPNDTQIQYANEMADAGVDYIVGSHPHALQPYDTIVSKTGKTVPIFYSLGNFTSHMVGRDITSDTGIVSLELEKKEAGEITINDEYIPCKMMSKYKDKKYVIVPCSAIEKDQDGYELMKTTQERISTILGKKIKITSN